MIKKTKAEKQAEYRKKKREELGDDEFKRLERIRQYNAYHANKPIIKKEDDKQEQEEQEEEPIQPLKPLKKRPNPIPKTELKENSIKSYVSTVRVLYNFYTKKELSDTHDIIKVINNQPYKYKNIKQDFAFLFDDKILNDIITRYNARLVSIFGIFSRIYGFTIIIKKIYPYINGTIEKRQTKRANRVIPDDIINTISFDTTEIIKKVEETKLNNYEKIIAYLLLLIPTRRLHDYRFTKNIDKIPNNNIDKTFNYYYNNNIYIYNTKNKKYDVIDIPEVISNLINKKDEYILGIKYTQSALSKLFINVIYKIYNIKINATLIRILYATYLRSLNLSGKDWEEKAKKMGHSLGENIKYSYVPKKDN